MNMEGPQFSTKAESRLYRQWGVDVIGMTNMPEAKVDLLKRLQSANVGYVDSIQVLPEAELEGKHQAIVTISVANLRSQPKHSAG